MTAMTLPVTELAMTSEDLVKGGHIPIQWSWEVKEVQMPCLVVAVPIVPMAIRTTYLPNGMTSRLYVDPRFVPRFSASMGKFIPVCHTTAGQDVRYVPMWMQQLPPTGSCTSLMQNLKRTYRGTHLGWNDQINLTDLNRYNEVLQASHHNYSCNHSFRHLREGIYPVDTDWGCFRYLTNSIIGGYNVTTDTFIEPPRDENERAWIQRYYQLCLFILDENSV